MQTLDKNTPVGVIGAGTMGTGIAQVASTFGHAVVVVEIDEGALESARSGLEKILHRQVEKGRLDEGVAAGIFSRIKFEASSSSVRPCGLVVEAIVENLDVKKELFAELESIVAGDCVLATNTSSLSIAAISSACSKPERVLGVHFFNPAPLMPLVEIVPGINTDGDVAAKIRSLIDAWGKTTVIAQDTPGFIVNRVARPFYGEALRILEEGIADAATIDWAMKEIGGFRMGPFELMDMIGHDVNFQVTESVFAAFFYDPRYRPSFTQKRMLEAGRLGRKSGQGFYDYREGASNPDPNTDKKLGNTILKRIQAMLINEAADALFWNVASRDDIDLAMTQGVNYPKGLLRWADEIGVDVVYRRLKKMQQTYGEDRYRPSPLLGRMVQKNRSFYD